MNVEIVVLNVRNVSSVSIDSLKFLGLLIVIFLLVRSGHVFDIVFVFPLSLCLRKRSKSKFERSHSAPWALSLLVVGVSLGPSFQIGLSS